MTPRNWFLALLLGTMLGLLGLSGGSAKAQERTLLLQGVTEAEAPGGIPGDLVVFGDRAFVAATGRAGSARLPVIAAARYGRGRALAAGHEAFFGAAALKNPESVRLAENVARWTSGKPLAGLRVGLLNQDAALRDALNKAGCQAKALASGDLPDALQNLDLLWLNQASLDGEANRARIIAARKWVEAGGGIVLTGPGWGWEEVTGRDLARDHSGNQILLPMGLAFAGGMLDATGKRGFLTGAEDSPLTQANNALNALKRRRWGMKR